MGRNFESNDSADNKQTNESADFTCQGFSAADQEAVMKNISQRSDSSVGQLDLEHSHETEHSRKMEFPHAWYENSKQTYGLPAEAAFTGGIDHSLKMGWNKLNK